MRSELRDLSSTGSVGYSWPMHEAVSSWLLRAGLHAPPIAVPSGGMGKVE